MTELNISLDTESGKPLYVQIYEFIRDAIRRGDFGKDEKLPSTRALAQFLQISRSTAETAYDQLLSEGYIEARKNRGYFVCGIENLYDLDGHGRPEALRFMGHGPAVPRQDGGKAPGKEAAGMSGGQGTGSAADVPDVSGTIDFSPRAVDMSRFPYDTWKRISRNTMDGANSELFSLGEPGGDFSFRATIARYLQLSRGVRCRPEQVIIGAGNDYLLMLLCRILGDGRKIGMEYVTYLRAFRLFRTMGYGVDPIRMDEQGMDAEALRRSGCDLAYVMPAHQYPTGITMPIARRMELLSWASEKKDRWLIEDDYDSEFRYRGRPIPSLQASDRFGRVIYIGTFSKSIAPAIRVSFLILPMELLRIYQEKFRFLSSTVSRIDQSLLNAFIRDGFFERYLNRMRNVYRGKQEIARREAEKLTERFSIRGADAGLYLVLEEKDVPGCFTGTGSRRGGKTPACTGAACIRREKELAAKAAEAGVTVYPLTENLIGDMTEAPQLPEGQKTAPMLLLGYAALRPEEIAEGMRRLEKAWLQDKKKS
jgi:GntR family transcriptional regulator/MocR family aminotransferase